MRRLPNSPDLLRREFYNRLLLAVGVATIVLWGMTPSLGLAQQVSIEQAIEMARAGQTAEALEVLAARYVADPDNRAVFHDYLTVLSWAGQDQRVAELSHRLSVVTAPGYALEAAAQSARRRGDYVQAEKLYRAGLQRFPETADFPAGLVLTLVDADRSQAALDVTAQLERSYPQSEALQLAKGYALETRRDFFAALQNYHRLLDRDPLNRAAQARRIMVLDSLGASHLAVELARQDPSLLSSDEWQRILSNQAAFAVRWGALPVADEGHRFDQTDRALALLERNRAALDPASSAAATFSPRSRFDRLVARRNRFQMTAVVREYEALRRDGVTTPNYVTAAAADAYLYLQQPEQAERLYRQILAAEPDDLNASLALFYTLIELEKFTAAYQLIDRLDQDLPAWLRSRHPDGGGSPRPNPNKIRITMTAALARGFGDQYAEADARLAAMHAQAPANLDITRELANVYAARGWPRRALQTYQLGLRIDHHHKELQLGLAQSFLERREYRLAEQAIDRLYSLYPEDSQVRRLHRRWATHNLRELRLEVGYADNSGATEGSHELLLAGTLFSRPLAYNFRMFVSGRYALAAFPEGDENYRRYGVGVEYRQPDLEAAAELTYNIDGESDYGARLSLLYEPDDLWSVLLDIERFSRETPLRALRQSITADSAGLGVSYRSSELRRIGFRAMLMDFSDGNLRRSLSASLEQRLLTRPKYKLTGIIDLYTSHNNRFDTIYFNPGHDHSAALTLVNVQRLYRRFDRVFSHRLSLTAGQYWQENFGNNYLAGFVYEHLWETAERFELVYGFSRFRRVYDGLPEFQNELHTRLIWRF